MALSVDKTLSKAQKLAKKGDVREAAVLYQTVLAKFPLNQRAKQGLEALTKPPANGNGPLRDPSRAEMDRVVSYQSRGQLPQMQAECEKLLKHYPRSFFLRSMLGFAFAVQGHPDKAVAAYRLAVALKPDAPEVYCNMGAALNMLGERDAAIDAFRRAIKIKPNYPEAYNNLGTTLKENGDRDEAITCFEKAFSLNAQYTAARDNLVRTLTEKGDEIREFGEKAEAAALYRKAIALNAGVLSPYFNYALVHKFTADDPILQKMHDMARSGALDCEQQTKIHYAIANAEMAAGHDAVAIEHLKLGNGLRRAELNYKFSKEEKWAGDIQTYFRAFSQTEFGPFEPLPFKPVFVLGMPRSGTSLTEQILASHSQVYGGGEMPHLTNAAREVRWFADERAPGTFAEIRAHYAKNVGALSDKPVIVDKLPHNFGLIGFIALALPEATIINMQRQPEAICWSNYKTYFNAKGMGFTCDMEDLAKFYNLYEDFMRFWRMRFPGAIHDFSYEALTEDSEAQVRYLLDLIGLEWEDGVMDFHTNKRKVHTASATQVRQPIYKGSSQEWERYRQFLTPILDILRTA